MAEAEFDVLILGAGSGGYACALRAAQLGLSVGLVEKGQPGRHLPPRRLHPDQGAAPRGRDRRRGPGLGEVRRAGLARGHRHGRRQRLQGRRRQPALQGPHRPDQGPRHHRHRGRGAAHRTARGHRRRHGVRRAARRARLRLLQQVAAGPRGRRRAGPHLRARAAPRPRARLRRGARRRRDRLRVRQRLEELRRRRHHRRGAPPARGRRGRGVVEGAGARVPQAWHRLPHRHPVPEREDHRHRRRRDRRGR